MLIARPAKRDNLGAFNRDMLYEIVEGDQPIGNLAFGIDTMRGAITLASKVYSVQRTSEGRDELLHEALIRAMKGGEPPKNPWTLKDDTGQVLALAERTYESFAVSRGGESFTFRKKWRPYHLYRSGSEQSLGSVGQRKFFTRLLHMDLPDEFDRPFQVFLLVLLLGLTLQNMESLGRSR